MYKPPIIQALALLPVISLLLSFSINCTSAAEPINVPGCVPENLLDDFYQAGMPEEILFVTRKPSYDGHWYANIGYYADNSCRVPFPINSGGKICIYNTKTKQTRTIFEDAQGNIRDPQIHYDGKKLVFSYLPAGKKHYSLYEINIDGTGLRQITGVGEDKPIDWPKNVNSLTTTEKRISPKRLDGEQDFFPPGWDDYEPTYTPDDKIIFCSTRAKRYVQCYYTQVGTLHKCNLDGTDLHCISANVEQDNNPWMLPDGRVIHMRWEYIDRHWGTFHHLWVVNPDGTRQMVYYGNFADWTAMLDPKPIPGTETIVCSFSPGHGRREHYGFITCIDPRLGPDNKRCVRMVTANPEYADPWAFDENHFMASNMTKIVLAKADLKADSKATEYATVYQLPDDLVQQGYWIGEPRPVMARPRERIITDSTDRTKSYGTLALANVYRGRKMKDLKPGTIKSLLIYEVLPKPVSHTGHMDQISMEGTFSVTRLIGSVPVSNEGSAYFNLPAMRSYLFCAMDEQGHCAKRMHSFTSVMPGEITTCIGCHEERTETPNADDREKLFKVMRQRPVDPEPIAGVPEIFSFPRDIQPILDEHCLPCHNHDREDGGFNISGDWGPIFPIGYMQMSYRNVFADNRNREAGNFDPYTIGTGAAQLVKLIESGHEGVKMPEDQQKIIRCWVDCGANYSGTYAANGAGGLGYYVCHTNLHNDRAWAEFQPAQEVFARRCDPCHAPTDEEKKIGKNNLVTEYKTNLDTRKEKNIFVAHSLCEDGGRYNRHTIFNLSYPEKSKAVRGPLSKSAGGLGICEAKSGKTVFANTNDPDYQTLLKYIQRGRKYILEEDNRFCMLHPSPNNGPDCPQQFIPRWAYLREMIRYGLLPIDTPPSTSIDPYKLDEAYYRLFWYKPETE